MSTHRLILTTRFGRDIHSPSMDDLRGAIDQLFDETDPDITQAAYETHPDAWLRHDTGNGPLIVVTVNRLARVHLDQWADADQQTTMAEALGRENVSRQDALLFWRMLAAGDIPDLQAVFSRDL